MKISHSEIDKKVCTKTHAKPSDDSDSPATYAAEPAGAQTAQCSGFHAEKKDQPFSKFAEVLGLLEGKNWPTGRYHQTQVKDVGPNSNAKAVAKDLIDLSREEKIKVAGLLAKTIEGGEVVEIRAVSSTSVMVNACYDLLSEGLGVVPYACVGLGGNFVGVVDEYSTIRPSLTLYARRK
ncbi:Major surface antigen 4 precursor [Anaplasma phagocytophilum]|uniref:Major surface antigen 4 n=1 Tax=Anaplasma phagocytophilum TaxID=948 RepID=A0AA45UU69_ANAPH|nr:Major surface antigen 4 precursor [Anaplasma phagocytophilum]